jgi:myosin heavy chain 9/10/11/14
MAARESAADFSRGDSVWIEDAREGYRLATVASVATAGSATLSDGRTVPWSALLPANPPSMDRVADNTQMMFLNEATLLHNLRSRFAADEMYTATGHLLISVNPYRWLPIYGDEWILRYAASGPAHALSNPPHVYSVANRAYRAMRAALLVRHPPHKLLALTSAAALPG